MSLICINGLSTDLVLEPIILDLTVMRLDSKSLPAIHHISDWRTHCISIGRICVIGKHWFDRALVLADKIKHRTDFKKPLDNQSIHWANLFFSPKRSVQTDGWRPSAGLWCVCRMYLMFAVVSPMSILSRLQITSFARLAVFAAFVTVCVETHQSSRQTIWRAFPSLCLAVWHYSN